MIDNDDGSPPWLLEDEFLQKYRIHHDSFTQLLHMIEGHPIFKTNIKHKQAPLSHQLLLFLHYVGKVAEAPATQSLLLYDDDWFDDTSSNDMMVGCSDKKGLV
jgi:hypothetical protein